MDDAALNNAEAEFRREVTFFGSDRFV